MTLMSVSATDIAALFPYSQDTLPRISTATFHDKFIENSSAVPFYDSVNGHLALVITEDDYLDVTGEEFDTPEDPSLNPILPP